MRSQLVVFASLPLLAAGCRHSGGRAGTTPEEAVVCMGKHALCSASFDCRIRGEMADCDCSPVDEIHIVLTGAIQDVEIKRQTRAKCTSAHGCAVDEAPVCAAIRDGKYEVDGATYRWVSTYSYRGWCELLDRKFVPCDPGKPGYTGDRQWAVCDAAPCTENPNPSDPNRPLICQCRVETGPFVGLGGCTGENGGIVSSFPMSDWDFEKNTYRIPLPGYEFVRGACEPVRPARPPAR